ncbi:MAG: hypothetical protein JW939_03965 [Candidatus Thermoplasmatota archaeon]|nr:hypothetical protein [Candidatus Thermoplasmatota archaeon]
MDIGFGYREIAAFSITVVVVIISVLAAFLDGVDELVDPEISMEVKASWSTIGPFQGQLPVEGKKWQVLSVEIDNLNEDSAFVVSVPHFYGTTGDNRRIWVFNSEEYGYEPIEPGDNLTVTLVFDIPMDEYLAGLEYVQRISGPLTCDVPYPQPYPINEP